MSKHKINAIIGQSGGPTSTINSSLVGLMFGLCGNVDKVFGMRNGISGLLANSIVDLNYLVNDSLALSMLRDTPGAFLGACRMRLPEDLDSIIYNQIFERLDQNNIKYFFYIGGNDSMDTVAKLSAYAKKKSLDVSIIGVPKTVDNDLVLTDHTPGYGSCAKYIGATVCELWQDVSSYDLPSVTILEVMGRDAGWLGCACALPMLRFGYGCSLVYLPERNFSKEKFLSDVEKALGKGKPIMVGVCEGINAFESLSGLDAFGHRALSGIGKVLEKSVREGLKCKARSIELNLPQRCAAHLVSLTDLVESEEIGKASAMLALEGKSGKMSAFVRRAGEYGVDITCVDAYLVANKTKYVPEDFINSEGNFVTDKCERYLSPLILGEKIIQLQNGLPRHFKLR